MTSDPLRTPAPVIARLESLRALLLTHAVQLILGAIAKVGATRLHQSICNFSVARKPVHLMERPLVPLKAQPLQAIDNCCNRSVRRALAVSVFNAKNEFTAMSSRVRPRVQCGSSTAYVQESGWARGESGTYHVGDRRKAQILPECKRVSAARPALVRQHALVYNSRCGVVSSAVEHCLHTAGVTGSNPVPPTSPTIYRLPSRPL